MFFIKKNSQTNEFSNFGNAVTAMQYSSLPQLSKQQLICALSLLWGEIFTAGKVGGSRA